MTTMLVTLDLNVYLKRLRAYKGDEEEFRQLMLNTHVFDALSGYEHVRDHGTLIGHVIDTVSVTKGTLQRYVTAKQLPVASVRRRVIQILYDRVVGLKRSPVRIRREPAPTQQELPLENAPDQMDLLPDPVLDDSPFGNGFQD